MEITEEEYKNLLMQSANISCQSDSIGELAKAVCMMQMTDLFSITDATNPFFKSKYSTLSSVWDAIREPLTTNGLAIVQTTSPLENGVVVVTTLMHESGEYIRGQLAGEIVPDKKGVRNPQGLLSLITYLRRAGVSAIVGLCPCDDDGESCVDRSDPTPKHTPKKVSTPAPKKVDASIPTEFEMVDYTMPSENSEAYAHMKEYRPDVVILNEDKTRLKVGKYTVETNDDGTKMWTDVPKFGTTGFDADACVPCLIASLLREHSVPFVQGKFNLIFEVAEEDK